MNRNVVVILFRVANQLQKSSPISQFGSFPNQNGQAVVASGQIPYIPQSKPANKNIVQSSVQNYATGSAVLKNRGTSQDHVGAVIKISGQDAERSYGEFKRTTGRESHWASQQSRLAVWFAAGAAPICYLSTFTSVAAKERATSNLPNEVVLYQYEACPFCNKVKAYLDYHDISYKVVEVNPIGKKEISWSEYKKVPVLVIDGQQLNDSTAIISTLEERLYPNKNGGDSGEEEAKWRKWVDDHLVHLLSPNIYRTVGEALEAFDYITVNGNFTAWERAMAKYSGAAAMYVIGKRLKKKYKIEDERDSLYRAGDEWMEALRGRPFLGGEKPNLADLAVFGVLRPIRQMQAGKDLMANSSISEWYERMEVEVGSSARLLP